MKAFILILSLMTFATVSQAQQWAYDSNAPYTLHQYSEEDPLEGKIPMSQDEIPSAVMRAFETSPFQHMEIVQAFRLQDQAMEEVITEDESTAPLFLYEIRLMYDGKQSCLYFTPDGQLYEGSQSV